MHNVGTFQETIGSTTEDFIRPQDWKRLHIGNSSCEKGEAMGGDGRASLGGGLVEGVEEGEDLGVALVVGHGVEDDAQELPEGRARRQRPPRPAQPRTRHQQLLHRAPGISRPSFKREGCVPW